MGRKLNSYIGREVRIERVDVDEAGRNQYNKNTWPKILRRFKKKRNILILAMLILGSIRQKSREQSDLFQAKDRKSAFKVR